MAIRELRLCHELAIAQVAERVDISRSMLSKIENGLASASTDTLAGVARALGVSMSMLFSKHDAAGRQSCATHSYSRRCEARVRTTR